MDPKGVLDLVGVYYLEKTNRLSLHCPFHHDTDPSAGIYLDTELFHCYACELTLDLIAFYARLKELNRFDATEELTSVLGKMKKRRRGNQIILLRVRRNGEICLRKLREILQMEEYALLGETLDRILLAYNRGQIDEEKLERAMGKWKEKLEENE